MLFTKPSLHPPVISSAETAALAERQLLSLLPARATLDAELAPDLSGFIEIPLTTVSESMNFDSFISVGFSSSVTPSALFPLTFDTGNPMLVVPYWEDIEALPDWQSNYQILCAGNEPWGCPANVVMGPIQILTKANRTYTLPNCVFYACTADSGGSRTATFGAGKIKIPPTACGNTVMLSPLEYNPARPYMEINLAPATDIFAEDGSLKVAPGSFLKLYREMPTGYDIFDIVPNMYWMSLVPLSLSIGKTKTGWPGNIASPIAMIDTGGGAANLSDPGGQLFNHHWPDTVPNPGWVKDSVNGCHASTKCNSTKTDITIELGDAEGSLTYTIDTQALPPSVRGLTLVMCENNCFMEGENGMNIGGVSALSLSVLVDYLNARVGLKIKTAHSAG